MKNNSQNDQPRLTYRQYQLGYERKRNNHPRYRQDYIDYVAMLTPEIWEKPTIKYSEEIWQKLRCQEQALVSKDIRENEEKANRLKKLLQGIQVLAKKGLASHQQMIDVTKLVRSIKMWENWNLELKQMKARIQEQIT